MSCIEDWRGICTSSVQWADLQLPPGKGCGATTAFLSSYPRCTLSPYRSSSAGSARRTMQDAPVPERSQQHDHCELPGSLVEGRCCRSTQTPLAHEGTSHQLQPSAKLKQQAARRRQTAFKRIAQISAACCYQHAKVTADAGDGCGQKGGNARQKAV